MIRIHSNFSRSAAWGAMCDLASKQVLQTCDDLGLAVDSSATGRFMSPDWSSKPEPVPYAKLGNPQTRRVKPYATEKF